MKKTTVLALLAAALMTTSGMAVAANNETASQPVQAESNMPAYAYGAMDDDFPGLSPEKQEVVQGIMKSSHARMEPLRIALQEKRMELSALSQNPNTKPEHISKVSNEITDLRQKMFAERQAVSEKIAKEVGVDMPTYGDRGRAMMRGGNHWRGGDHWRGYDHMRGEGYRWGGHRNGGHWRGNGNCGYYN